MAHIPFELTDENGKVFLLTIEWLVVDFEENAAR